MIVKEFRELRRDRRTLAMLIALPLLLLVIFGYAANFRVATVKAAVVGPQAAQVAASLPSSFFDVTVTQPSDSQADAVRLLHDRTVDVAIVTGRAPVLALVDGSNLFAAQSIVSVLNKEGNKVSTQILFNPELKTSWVMVPAIIGLILAFIGTIVTSIGLVRERETGTLEQLAVMPIKPSTVILGKISPYFLVCSIDVLIITMLGMLLFDVPFNWERVRVRARGRAVPVCGVGARRLHLDDLADHRASDPDRVLLHAAADPAVGHDLPAGRDGCRGPVDRLPAAADVLHYDLPGGDASRGVAGIPVVAVPRAHADGHRGIQRRHPPVPP